MSKRSIDPLLVGGFRLPRTFAALRYPNYRLWFFGQTVSLIGTWMQSIAQGWLVYQLTGSDLALGTISFIGTIPTLFLMLPAGAITDRVNKRTLLLATQTVMMLLAFIMTALSATGMLQVWHIALLAAALGVAQSFDAPARQALAVAMVDDRADLMNAIALNSAIFNLARVIGPAIGGIVLATLGATWCFGLNGLSFLAVIAGLWLMKLPANQDPVPQRSLVQQTLEGLRYIRTNAPIRNMIAIMGVSGIFGMSYAVLLPAFAADVLRVGETGLGALNTAVGLGALAGALAVASLSRYRRKGMLATLGSTLFPAMLIVFALSRNMPLALVCLAISGWAIVVQNSTINTLIQGIVPDQLRGRVMAVFSLMIFGTTPFGSLQAGAIAQVLGPPAGVAVGALITLVFAASMALLQPSLRRMEG